MYPLQLYAANLQVILVENGIMWANSPTFALNIHYAYTTRYPYAMIGDPAIYRLLEELAIPFEYHEHAPAPTIEEAMRYWKDIEGAHCKNLFMRNHKGNQHYMLVAEGAVDVDISRLEKSLHQGKLSFASPQRMLKYLGVEPGAVSPLALVRDADHHVILYMDAPLRSAPSLCFHPGDCRASLVIPNRGFLRYMEHLGNRVIFADLARTAP